MLYGWNKFRGWEILEFFLEGNGKIHVNGLAKELKISKGTAQEYLTNYEKQGLLEKERIANLVNYKLIDTPLTIELRKTYFISKIIPHIKYFLSENKVISTLAMYGSHAKGSYDSKSDIDLLILSQDKRINLDSLKKIEEKLGKEIKTQVFNLREWRNLLDKKDNFAIAIVKNNILLFGEPL